MRHSHNVIIVLLLLALPYMANASLGFGSFFVSRCAEIRLNQHGRSNTVLKICIVFQLFLRTVEKIFEALTD